MTQNADPAFSIPDNLKQKLDIARTLTHICYGGMIALFTLLNLTRETGSIALWLLQCFPLLILLPGMAQQRHRSYSWLCFVVLLYFTAYVVEVGSPLFIWTDTVALALTVVMFNSSMMTSRWMQRWQYHCYLTQGAGATSNAPTIEQAAPTDVEKEDR